MDTSILVEIFCHLAMQNYASIFTDTFTKIARLGRGKDHNYISPSSKYR